MSDTANQATGIAGAAQSFEALLAGGNPDLKAPELAEATEAPAENAEAFEGDAEGEETASYSADTEADADEAPESEAAADEEPDEASDEQAPQLVTVKINGKEEQVPFDEVVKGYQRQADYSRKTAALAEERRAFDAERQRVAEERGQYAHLLAALQQQIQQTLPQEPDWQRLYHEDPIEYVRQKEAWRDQQERLVAAQFEQQRIMSMQAQEQQAALSELVQQNRQKLVEAVPAWKDAKRWEQDRPKLLEYGQTLGFTPEELSQTYDHRAVVALWKAMQYDQLVKNRPQPTQAKGPRVAPPGSAATAPKRASSVTKAKQRLAQTGKIADAASLFETFLD